MDDTFVILQGEPSNQFLQHINSIDPYILFTMENNMDNGSIPFLAPLVSPRPNDALTSSVYWKPKHMDQYLHWDSNHNFLAKSSVFNTLTHKTKVNCNNQLQLKEGEDNIKQCLLSYNYPTSGLNKL